MPISELARRLISHCEHQWFLKGVLPTPEQLKTEFELSSRGLNQILSDPQVIQSFEARGIPTISGRSLSPEQLTAINTLLNFADTRSEKKKLADMGIEPTKWAGWKQNPAFKEYFLARTESILADSIPDANMALVERARNGDLGAIKLVYEMTGRYKADQAGLDPRALLNKVFEIISMHVQDPNALLAISHEFAKLAGVAQDDTINHEPPVAGVVVPNQIESGF